MEHVKKPIDWFINEAHSLAVEKGWYLRKRSFNELIALIYSEVGEAVEALRTNAKSDKIEWMHGIQEECADITIRIFDMCGYFNIDLGASLSSLMPNYVNLDGDDMEMAFIHLMDAMQENFPIDHYSPIERLAKIGKLIGCSMLSFEKHSAHAYSIGLPLAIVFLEMAHLLADHDGDCYLGCAIIAKHEYNKTRPHRHGEKLY